MISVPLTQGKTATVSAQDAACVLAHKWLAAERPDGRTAYACRWVLGKPVYLHRFLLSAEPGQIVDHINGNGLDNRRENLRFATASQNSANCVGYSTASPYKGVYPNRTGGKWHAKLMKHGVTHRISGFASAFEAAVAYDKLATEHHGDFAKLNFPKGDN